MRRLLSGYDLDFVSLHYPCPDVAVLSYRSLGWPEYQNALTSKVESRRGFSLTQAGTDLAHIENFIMSLAVGAVSLECAASFNPPPRPQRDKWISRITGMLIDGAAALDPQGANAVELAKLKQLAELLKMEE